MISVLKVQEIRMDTDKAVQEGILHVKSCETCIKGRKCLEMWLSDAKVALNREKMEFPWHFRF